MKFKIFSQICGLYTLFQISNVLAQRCILTESNMNRNWIFLDHNDLLRKDYINECESLTLYCNENTEPIDLFCRQGTLDPMPEGAVCQNRLKMTVEPQYASCHSAGVDGQMYDMVYRFSTGTRIVLYIICYSTSHETVLFSIHKTYGFEMKTPNYQRPQFRLLGNPNRQRSSSFDADIIFSTFKNLLGQHQTYVRSDRDYAVQRGHMTNAQDFLTYDQKDTTFLYMNVVPMSRGCNLRNWKRIENWIHGQSSTTVLTGTHDVLYLQHSHTHRLVPMYLMPERKNPMPLWLYKVVNVNGECFVFVTLNDHSSKPAITNTDICVPTPCPLGLSFDSEPEACISYCCQYQHFVAQVGQFVNICPNHDRVLAARLLLLHIHS